MGELAASSFPSEHIKFTVEQINPIAAVVRTRTMCFKVRVEVDRCHARRSQGQLDEAGDGWDREGGCGAGTVRVDLDASAGELGAVETVAVRELRSQNLELPEARREWGWAVG